LNGGVYFLRLWCSLRSAWPAMGLVHNLIGRVLGQMMMHLDALGFAIAMALIARMARPADVGGLTVRLCGNWRGQVNLIAMAI
jgi:hypothetical protein